MIFQNLMSMSSSGLGSSQFNKISIPFVLVGCKVGYSRMKPNFFSLNYKKKNRPRLRKKLLFIQYTGRFLYYKRSLQKEVNTALQNKQSSVKLRIMIPSNSQKLQTRIQKAKTTQTMKKVAIISAFFSSVQICSEQSKNP